MDFPEEENNSVAFQQQQDSQESQPEYEIANNFYKTDTDLFENYQDKKSKMLLCRKSGKLSKEEKKELKRQKKLMKKRAKLNEKMNLKMIIKGENLTQPEESTQTNLFSNATATIVRPETNTTSVSTAEDTLNVGGFYNNEDSHSLPKCKKRKHKRSHAGEKYYNESKTENCRDEHVESSNDELTNKKDYFHFLDTDDEEYDVEDRVALKNFFRHITLNMKAKHDEVDKYFLVLASTIKKCHLTPLELTQLQCNLLSYLKEELIKMGKM